MSMAGFQCYRVRRDDEATLALIVIALPPTAPTWEAEVFTIRPTPAPGPTLRRVSMRAGQMMRASDARAFLCSQARHQVRVDLSLDDDAPLRWRKAALHDLAHWPVQGADHPFWVLHDRTRCPMLRTAVRQYLQPSEPWRLRRMPPPTALEDAATLQARPSL